MTLSFTAQDTLSLLFAILLFPTVLVFPGFVIGWTLDIFAFKQRTLLAQYVIAVALSNAIVPTILFLVFRFGSNLLGVGIVGIFFILWVVIQIKQLTKYHFNLEVTQGHKMAFLIGLIWIAVCIFLLVDLQIGQRLYFNSASYDFTTRTALIEAITRTGVPPVNPGYYPGHFEKITELYYFWHILGSVIDMLGGNWVDARIALFAGVAWSGLSLIATIATYLRIRAYQMGADVWRASKLGAQLLAVSGLDFIPAIAIMIAAKITYGNLPLEARVESWNQPIISWLNAVTWVPNHVTGMAACVIAMLAIISSQQFTKFRWTSYVIVAAVSIGSAFGLSTWVAFTFGLFLAVFGGSLLFQKSDRAMFAAIIVAGALGLFLAGPFLIDILRSGGKSEVIGTFPIALYVRPFSFSQMLAPGVREAVALLLLPVNYFFELGFFFVVGVLWIKQRAKSQNWWRNSFWMAEILLLTTVATLLSFVRSTVLGINDLGIRGWLLGQFALIIWAVDILSASSKEPSWLTFSFVRSTPNSKRIVIWSLF